MVAGSLPSIPLRSQG